jgi:hypothetical protein
MVVVPAVSAVARPTVAPELEMVATPGVDDDHAAEVVTFAVL